MKLLHIYIFLILLSQLFISCENKNEPNICNNVDIDIDKKTEVINIDNMLDDDGHQLIKLESSLPIGEVSKLQVKSDTIYFISQRILYLFDIEGNYISKIDKRGRSRMEYIELTNYCIGDNCIYILDNASMKINSYNYNGDFIESINIKRYWANDIFFFENHIYLINRSSDTSIGKYRIIKIDLDGNLVNKYLHFDHEFAETNDGSSYMISNATTVSLCIAPDNTIYNITNESCNPIVYLNFMDKNLPSKYYIYNLRQLINEGIVEDYVLGVENLKGNGIYTFVDFWFNNSLIHAIFNSNNEVIGIGDNIEIDNYYKIDANNYYIFDDYLYVVIDANVFKIVTDLIVSEQMDRSNTYLQDLQELSAQTKDSDNPIIVAYKLHD